MKLWHYIQGTRKGKEAHRIEKEAMSDPFLADALEGFEKVKGNHAEAIEQLRKQITQSSKKKKTHSLRGWSIAASLLIAIGAGTYFLLKDVQLPVVPVSEIYVDAMKEECISPTGSFAATADSVANTSSEAPTMAQSHSAKKEIAAAPPAVAADRITIVEDDTPVINKEVNPVSSQKPQSTRTAQQTTLTKTQKAGKVRGTITDEQGEPLTGVSVLINGTNQGTLTDTAGNFELFSNNGEKINIQYIGYNPVILPADTGKTMMIAMHESQDSLDEVVVVGYGKKNKKNVSPPKPVHGERAYRKYLKANLIPPTGECKESKGEVILTLQVDEHGRPYNVRIQKSLCSSADQEALRLVKEGPDWQTGTGTATVIVKF